MTQTVTKFFLVSPYEYTAEAHGLEMTVMLKPKIYDDDKSSITVQVDHAVVQSWVYANDDDRREKMRHAHYFCDGYMCAMGAPLRQVGVDN